MKQKYKIHTIEKQQTTFFINLIILYSLIITLHFTYCINLSLFGGLGAAITPCTVNIR